jgi:signal transduction histidine kinase
MDNGKGFIINEVKKGYGLKNITDRAKKAGAQVSISSNLQKGTVIKLEICLEK